MKEDTGTFLIGILVGVVGVGLLSSFLGTVLKGCAGYVERPLFRIEVVLPKEKP